MMRHERLIITGMNALCVLLSGSPAGAQPTPALTGESDTPGLLTVEQAELYRLVKHFDFDERRLGNYQDTPMHWVQLRGEGLPALYANGRFDDDVGRRAAPSFRLDIATGNVAYEYRHLDLTVVPESDYSVVGHVRPAGLKFSAAFVAAYFVDRFGERIAGSERVSNLVRATGRDPEPWQTLEVDLPGEFPLAYALRLQFWILQDYVWRERDPHGIDPIVRRDVYATAWFDDFSVYRLPRVQLRLSNPAGLIRPGKPEEFILEVNNAASQPLRAELRVTDSVGRPRHTQVLDVPAMTRPADSAPDDSPTAPATARGLTLAMAQRSHMVAIRTAVPELTPGFYTAQLRLLSGSDALLKRTTRFTVLPELPTRTVRSPDIGVDLGRWEGGEIAGLRELLTTLSCGAIKVGIPTVGHLGGEERTSYFQQLSTLLQVLTEDRIDVTGVILTPPTTDSLGAGESTREFVARGGDWRELLSPILAHFGALLPTWQLGSEAIELRDAGQWRPADVERVRDLLGKFISIPKLAIPQPVTAVWPYKDDTISVWIPPNLPTRTLPAQLEFLVDVEASSCWLQLATSQRHNLSSSRRANDLARRVVLAKALGPGRVFLPAPFHVYRSGGQPTWQPTEDFLVLRTLFHYLAGKTAVVAMTPAPDTLAVIFQGADASCMIAWSWRQEPPAEPIELYLGANPRAIDIWGKPVPLEVTRGRTRVPVAPTPLIIDALNTPLAALQTSYRIAPTYVQVHDPEPRPVLTFRNPYAARLSGEVRLSPPRNWQIEPTVRSFQLEPGGTFAEPLTLILPPRQVAQVYKLDVRLRLHSPEQTELYFSESLTVGLRDIALETTAYWQGNDLLVEQSLRNLCEKPVNFTAFCDAPGRSRQEREFLEVAPGELSVQTYSFPTSRDLAGAKLRLGAQEIDGARRLNQFVEVPR